MGCTGLCKGCKMVAFGAIIIINEVYSWYNGWILLGSLMIILGIAKMFLPCCPCGGKCASDCRVEVKAESSSKAEAVNKKKPSKSRKKK